MGIASIFDDSALGGIVVGGTRALTAASVTGEASCVAILKKEKGWIKWTENGVKNFEKFYGPLDESPTVNRYLSDTQKKHIDKALVEKLLEDGYLAKMDGWTHIYSTAL